MRCYGDHYLYLLQDLGLHSIFEGAWDSHVWGSGTYTFYRLQGCNYFDNWLLLVSVGRCLLGLESIGCGEGRGD